MTADVLDPTKVAVKYNHRSFTYPDTNAGARDLAGFIDAPETNAKKKMSRPTIQPIMILPNPRNPLLCTTNKITDINNAVAKISTPTINGIG